MNSYSTTTNRKLKVRFHVSVNLFDTIFLLQRILFSGSLHQSAYYLT